MLMVFVILAYINFIAIAQGKWYVDKQLADRTIRSMFKNICVECEIDIKGRNICNHPGRKTSIFELFDLGIPENTGMAIIGHNSVGGYHAYAKPNNNHKREALSGIVNRLDGLPSLPSSNTTIGNSVFGFCTAKEIMQKDNHNSAEPDESHTFKKRKITNTRG
ncbi:hypothetical protein GLOIN_2v1784178 [Rhizophagus clarus]|nr:hypothetical protein GLOIN_2v1784178 [Rhizophagus clarus]